MAGRSVQVGLQDFGFLLFPLFGVGGLFREVGDAGVDVALVEFDVAFGERELVAGFAVLEEDGGVEDEVGGDGGVGHFEGGIDERARVGGAGEAEEFGGAGFDEGVAVFLRRSLGPFLRIGGGHFPKALQVMSAQ